MSTFELNMKALLLSIIFFIILLPVLNAQTSIDSINKESIYSPPLNIPLILAGNFGELRSNHFHSGLDIKTQQREGLMIKTIADGYVSRIKISPWGYGKVLYIKHANGVSSVYAHLQKFSPEIEAYIKDEQYQKKTFTLDLYLSKNKIQVFKDSLIAYSGNTGGSTAPHLHFEMRKSGSGIALNPLLFNNSIKDQTPPELEKIFVYPIEEGSHVNGSEKKVQLTYKKQIDGTYLASPIKTKGSFSFGVKAYDRQDLAANKNGVYMYSLFKNDTLVSRIHFNEFSFYETRYINTLIDYEHLIKYGERVLLLYKTPSNPLSVFNAISNKGVVSLNLNEKSTLKLELRDLDGNTTKLIIPVSASLENAVVKKKVIKTPYPIYYKNPAHFKFETTSLYFPAKSFYQNLYLEITEKQDTIKVHNSKVPMHKDFTVSFKPKANPYSEKTYIGYQLYKNKVVYSPTKRDNGWLSTKSKKLGTYLLQKDSIAPIIKARNFKANQNIKNYQFLSLSIKDAQSGIKSYNAFLNNQWILMEYEPKNNTITHHISERTPLTKTNILEVIVIDMLNNISTYSTTLTK